MDSIERPSGLLSPGVLGLLLQSISNDLPIPCALLLLLLLLLRRTLTLFWMLEGLTMVISKLPGKVGEQPAGATPVGVRMAVTPWGWGAAAARPAAARRARVNFILTESESR